MDITPTIDVEIRRNSGSIKQAADGGILKSRGGRVQSSRQSVTFRDNPLLSDRLTSPQLNSQEVKRIVAARAIERAWLSYRDRKMYHLLKHATCAAEQSLSYEILRKISPREANLLRDKGLPVKVRFRFGGCEFPPMVYFKIFSDTSVSRVKYMSGKKAIRPASKAAEEACDQMGKRKFLQIMVQDSMCHERYKVTNEMDVTTLKDYMQYLSHLDELPSYMGGKDNYWRKLTLDVIPRQTIFYDIMDFLYHKKMTQRLLEEMPLLAKSPVNADMELRHIETISRMSTPAAPQHTPTKLERVPGSGRGSKQAKHRARQMKKMYGLLTTPPVLNEENIGVPSDEEELNAEAEKLFQWTQELSFDELDRIHSSQPIVS